MNGFQIRMLNGLGVTASKQRNIKPGNEFDQYFPKPEYTDPLYMQNGANEDTIDRLIPRMVTQYGSDTERIATVLKQKTLEATCRAIWVFLYDHVQYHLDSPMEEQVRRPARTWADRTRGVDCDCYTMFISSVLCNLRVPHYLRMASYRPLRGYQHIYVVVPKKWGADMSKAENYWTIDPVMDAFNAEKPYIKRHDKSMIPAKGLDHGLAGFPIRTLNGGFSGRSDLVYPDVYFNPSLDTWALKGLDGGFYIQGDPLRRHVEPLDGVGMGWIGTALKIGKGAFNLGKKLFKKKSPAQQEAASTEKDAKKAEKDGDKGERKAERASNKAARQAERVANKAARQSARETRKAQKEMQKSIQSSNVAAMSALQTVNKQNAANTVAVQNVLADKIKASNNATIMSLSSMDKAMKDKLTVFGTNFGGQVAQMAAQGASLAEIVAQSKAITLDAAKQTAGLQTQYNQNTGALVAQLNSEQKKAEESRNSMSRNMKMIIGAVVVIAVAVTILLIMRSRKKN